MLNISFLALLVEQWKLRVCIVVNRKISKSRSMILTLVRHTLPSADSWYRKPSPRLCPGFVLILMERQRNQAFCVTAADWSHDHDLMNINLSDKLDNLNM